MDTRSGARDVTAAQDAGWASTLLLKLLMYVHLLYFHAGSARHTSELPRAVREKPPETKHSNFLLPGAFCLKFVSQSTAFT